MSILFPAMLAGLAGLSIPVLLHLISRHKFPIQDFPSLRLLQAEERANVFAPKLVDVLQLILRLLVLLLLVLAMSRLFAGWASSGPRRGISWWSSIARPACEWKCPRSMGWDGRR